jgi:hypothetical protein
MIWPGRSFDVAWIALWGMHLVGVGVASAKAPISVLSAGLPTNTGPPASHYRPIAT